MRLHEGGDAMIGRETRMLLRHCNSRVTVSTRWQTRPSAPGAPTRSAQKSARRGSGAAAGKSSTRDPGARCRDISEALMCEMICRPPTTGDGCRVAPAYARPSTPGARVSDAERGRRDSSARLPSPRFGGSSHHRRFVPCDGCRHESAARRAGTAAHERRSRSRPQRPQAPAGSRVR